jgi:AcrR family transcriptional regulator
MRKLALDLGVEAMSLYNHVRHKEDLLDGMAELVVGEIDIRPRRQPWKVALRRQVMGARTVMLRHPWAARVIESRRTMSPVMVRYLESIMRMLREGGFSVDQAHHTLHVLGSRILGFNQDLFEDTSSLDQSPDVAATFAREMATQFPYISELAASVSHDGGLGGCDDDFEFAFGLDLILDGLERLLDAHAPVTPVAPPTNGPEPLLTRAVADLRRAALGGNDRDLQRQLRATVVDLLDSVLEPPGLGAAPKRRRSAG